MVYIINPNSPNLCPAKKPGLTVIFNRKYARWEKPLAKRRGL